MDLEYTRIAAPINGMIGRSLLDAGNVVSKDSALATIVVVEPLHVYFDVDERTLLRLRRLVSDSAAKDRKVVVQVRTPTDEDSSRQAVIDFSDTRVDPATGTLGAVNHPFTAPHPDDVPLLDTAPERARALAYDMVLNGTELGGGSLRIADPRLQRRVFELLGIPEAQAEQRFGFLLEGLRAGAPPHGGFAFGMDRIVMLLAGADSLRDVIAFPKTTAQRALFEGAPTAVDPGDLRELNLEVKGEG